MTAVKCTITTNEVTKPAAPEFTTPMLPELSGFWRVTSTKGFEEYHIKNLIKDYQSPLGLIFQFETNNLDSNQFDRSMYFGNGIQLRKRSVLIQEKKVAMEMNHETNDYIEANQWITLIRKTDGYCLRKSVKSIENGKLVMQQVFDNGGFTLVLEKIESLSRGQMFLMKWSKVFLNNIRMFI